MHGCSCEKGEIYQAATFCTHTKSWMPKAVQLQYSFQLDRKDSFCDCMDEEIPHGKSNPQGETVTSLYEYFLNTWIKVSQNVNQQIRINIKW